MKRIIIEDNCIVSDGDKDFSVNDGKIEFYNNGEYEIDIRKCNNIRVLLNILDGVSVKVFVYGVGCDMKSKFIYKLGKSSNLMLFKFYNNMGVDEENYIYLDGEYGKVSYNFSSISKGIEKYKMSIFHNDNYVDSYVSNKCIGNDGSCICFDIDSVLDKGNVGCCMDQDTKIICMGDVDARISPNMFIEEDDVEARHGSVIGRFSDDDIFYLMSRGISFDEVIKLLVKGFILSNLVVDMDSRSKILMNIRDIYK